MDRDNQEDGGEGGGIGRREALVLTLTAAGSLAAGYALRGAAAATPLRPPGALPGDDFLAACIRCFQCGSVCPNQCIQFTGSAGGVAAAYAPYILPREQACILCMKCTQACPTDALTPIDSDPDVVAAEVRMGTANIDEDLCYSYNGRPCGVCYYACPFPDTALRLALYAKPVIDADACVGCGNCERACIHLPQAVRITPAGRDTPAGRET